ncbi:uncharacterized protein DFL_004468 [Arthrobotrys flagrans]|uniref:Uncharacterized protein n=1 Tax=Arthrobotrys flagrans TaxID=97331 RepID=A0A437A4W6_ARTFL|nr:hypothetical protein DFL_004468 [Arthrobotrys flagrans]
MEGKAPNHPSDSIRRLYFQITLVEKELYDSDETPSPIPPLTRSVPSTVKSRTAFYPKRVASYSGIPSHTKAKFLPSLHQSTISSVLECPSQTSLEESEPQQTSNQTSTMKKKKRDKDEAKDKSRRSSRRQSILSMAPSHFGRMAFGSDISLDRQISPALQASHVFFADDDFGNPPSPSHYSLSQTKLPNDASPTTSAALATTISQGPDLSSLPPPTRFSPPALSLVSSAQLTPAASRDSGSSNVRNTNRAIETTTASPTLPTATRRNSKLSSINSFLYSLEARRTSMADFFQDARGLPSRLFRKSSKPLPEPQLRSTFKFTEKDTLPPNKIPMSKSERYMTKLRKQTKRSIKKDSKHYKRKAKMEKRELMHTIYQDPRWKEIHKRDAPAQKLSKMLNDAKEKVWDWIDKKEENKRRKRVEAHRIMSEERRRSVVLVPVERDYEVLSRRGSRYSTSRSTSVSHREGSLGRPGVLERAD